MKPKYIQLLPLPSDLLAEVIEMIWLYTQRRFVKDFLIKFTKNS